jgi:hypothetical protein
VGSDNRINSLCNCLLASSSDDEIAALAFELKVAVHEHIESLRTQLKGSLKRYPSDEYGSRRLPRSDKGRYLARDSGRRAALFSLFVNVVLHD